LNYFNLVGGRGSEPLQSRNSGGLGKLCGWKKSLELQKMVSYNINP